MDAAKVERAGVAVLRWGLVLILVWYGTYKFSPSEAAAIRPLVENSPFMSWMYAFLSEGAVSALIGVSELVVAAAIALRAWKPGASALGSLGAVGIFLVTLSFLVTTPGAIGSAPDYPLPLPRGPGGFLLKDLFLLGGALITAAEALRAREAGARSA